MIFATEAKPLRLKKCFLSLRGVYTERNECAQDMPFGFAQDMPFGFAQDMPFGFAQDMPFGFAQDMPFESLWLIKSCPYGSCGKICVLCPFLST